MALLGAAMLGLGSALGRSDNGVIGPVTEFRMPGSGKRNKRQEELALRAKPIVPSIETRQQRRARERGYLA